MRVCICVYIHTCNHFQHVQTCAILFNSFLGTHTTCADAITYTQVMHAYMYFVYAFMNVIMSKISNLFKVCFSLSLDREHKMYGCNYIHTCTYRYMHTYIYIIRYIYIQIHIRTYAERLNMTIKHTENTLHTYIHTYIHTYVHIHTYTHNIHRHTYIHTYIHT